MKYVFVDMDGVIAEYGYPSGLYDGDFQRGNYVGKKPVTSVINEIITKYNNSDYILMVCSASPNAKATMEKNDWLNNNFAVPYENRIFITPSEDKVEVIRYYIEDIMHGNVQEHAIIIDDKGSVLAKAHSLGMECYHPTQIMAIKAQQDLIEAEEAAKQQEQQEEVVTEPQPMEESSAPEPEVVSPVEVENNYTEGEQLSIDDIMEKEDN